MAQNTGLYGRGRNKARGDPTDYKQFNFGMGARHWLSGQDSVQGNNQNAVADYNALTRNLQNRQLGGANISQYNKDKFLSALGHLQNKAQQTAEAKYAEYMESVGDAKFASQPGSGGAFMRPANEFDLSENTGSYTGDPKSLFKVNSYGTPETDMYNPRSYSGGNWAKKIASRISGGTHNPYSHPERLNFGQWT